MGHKISTLDSMNRALSGDDLIEVAMAGTPGQYHSRKATALELAEGVSSGLFIQNGTGAVSKLAQSKMREIFSVKDFGATGDGVTDDAAAIQLAINAALAAGGKEVRFPAGTYQIGAMLQVGGTGIHLVGDGRNATILRNTTANIATIRVTPGSNNISVSDMTLTRTPTATSGGDGIQFGYNGGADGNMYRIYSTRNYYGFALWGAGYGVGEELYADKNISHGFYQRNHATLTSSQWYLGNCISQLNGGAGFLAQSIASPGMALGEYFRCRAFANSLQGFCFAGQVGIPIYAVRMTSCFIGQDGGDEVYLDTYGTHNRIMDTFIELGGTGLTGPDYDTPATNDSWGIVITANTLDVHIIGTIINGQSNAGVYSDGPDVQIVGGRFTNNGLVGTGGAGYLSGIYANSGCMKVVGATAYGNPSYGFYSSTGTHQVIGCDLRTNTDGDIGGVVATIEQTGNLPNPSAIAPTLTNSWVNVGSGFQTAGYRKVGGRVYLQGRISSGTVGQAAFTLPAGYRPSMLETFACDSNNAYGQVYVSTAGIVVPSVGNNTFFNLDGISFQAA